MIKNVFVVFFLFSSFVFAQLFQPTLILQQSSFDFGDIKQGDKVSHTFVISNGGGDLLKISDVKASCGCTAAAPDKRELAPGESTNLVVTFNSTGRMGKQSKTVRIYSNDPKNPEMQLSITGNVVSASEMSSGVPTIYFGETQHDFGKVNEGDKVNYTFNFANKGSSVLTIKDIKTSCGCTAALLSQDSLAPGKDGTIKVELDTKNRSGKMSRTVTINSNDPKDPAKVLTIYADIVKKGS
ncbi:MAG: DUF1573 domain-containing protein [Ignavibacteriaceae bacterium]|jgi:Cu/Ag efflux protein CusF|nr:DUF1573 domain-containing protein [Ignavibacteriaceae bacterium]